MAAFNMDDDKQVREALEAGEILLSEYIDLRPEEQGDARAIPARSRILLMRAEDTRLELQGRVGMLLRHEYGGLNPGLGVIVFYNEEGTPTRISHSTLIKVVGPDDGMLDDEGRFQKFPQLHVFRRGEAHKGFDEWWMFAIIQGGIEHNLHNAVASGTYSTMEFVRMVARAAWREVERNKR